MTDWRAKLEEWIRDHPVPFNPAGRDTSGSIPHEALEKLLPEIEKAAEELGITLVVIED